MSDDTQRVWDLMEKFSICMMSTWNGEEQRLRPMAAHLKRDENQILFLTDTRWHADDEIAKYPKLALAFADNGDQKYVALAGRGTVSNDRTRIKELFSMPAKAWWDSADDPNIRLLTVTPVGAEYWDGRGKVASYLSMAMAAATGTRPDVGEKRKVSLS